MPHIQGTPHLFARTIWLTPTFHSPSFLTLRMTPLKISVGEGGLRMLGPLLPTHTLKPSGFQAGLPSSLLFTPPPFCDVAPGVTPQLVNREVEVRRGQVRD